MSEFNCQRTILVCLTILIIALDVSISHPCVAMTDHKAGQDSLVSYEVKDLRFQSGQNSMAGRLFLPRGQANFPVLIYVEGSDNGNTNEHPYVRALAKGFTKGGIGLFSFNKRGNAGSSGRASDDFGMRAEDIVSAYQFLLSRDDVDAKNIGLYGISQAGWVIPLVLGKLRTIPFVILVSPAGVCPSEQVTFYLENQWRKVGMERKDIPHARDLHRIVAHYYSTGSEADYQKAQAAVRRVRMEPWFSLLHKVDYREEIPDSGDLPSPRQISAISKTNPEEYAFYRSPQNWFEDPVLYESIKCPVLMIYGGKDEIVPVEQSLSIFQRAFSKNENPDVTFRVYESAGHDIQPAGSPYLMEGYREYMADWVHHHLRTGSE